MIYETPPTGFHPSFDVVACYVRHAGRFILLQRAPGKKQALLWGVPAGKVDGDETPLEAMQREIQEEIGLGVTVEQLAHIESLFVRYDHAQDSQYDFVYHVFVLDMETDHHIVLSPSEHVAFRWVTPKEALAMDFIWDLDRCLERHAAILGNKE